jgi:hypothetical protein
MADDYPLTHTLMFLKNKASLNSDEQQFHQYQQNE